MFYPTKLKKDIKMKKPLLFIGLLGMLSGNAHAANVNAQDESCEQIRTQIKAKTGVPLKVDIELLQKLSTRSECRFSTPEVFRAAYGDRPLPKSEVREGRAKHDHDDDD
jgi:hypothetical protein